MRFLFLLFLLSACGPHVAVRDHPRFDPRSELPGMWSFTHGEEPWGVLHILEPVPGLYEGRFELWYSESWAQVVTLEIALEGEALTMKGWYASGGDRADVIMELVMVNDHGITTLRGSIRGETYSEPIPLFGERQTEPR